MSKNILMGPKIYFKRDDDWGDEGSDTGDGSAQTGYNWPYSVWVESLEALNWDADHGNGNGKFSYAEYEAWWSYMRFTGNPNYDIEDQDPGQP